MSRSTGGRVQAQGISGRELPPFSPGTPCSIHIVGPLRVCVCVGGGTQCPGLAQLAWAHGGFPGAQAKLHFTSFSGAGATVGFVGVRRGHSENQA